MSRVDLDAIEARLLQDAGRAGEAFDDIENVGFGRGARTAELPIMSSCTAEGASGVSVTRRGHWRPGWLICPQSCPPPAWTGPPSA